MVFCWYFFGKKLIQEKNGIDCCGLPFGALGIIHRYSGFILRTIHIVGFVWLVFGTGETGGRADRSVQTGGRAVGRSVGRSVGRMDDIYDIYRGIYTHIYIIYTYTYIIVDWAPRFIYIF